jgi:hypothetical protein
MGIFRLDLELRIVTSAFSPVVLHSYAPPVSPLMNVTRFKRRTAVTSVALKKGHPIVRVARPPRAHVASNPAYSPVWFTFPLYS